MECLLDVDFPDASQKKASSAQGPDTRITKQKSVEILEKSARGGNRPRGLPYHVSLLHRHRAISWYAFGVASLVEFQGSRVGLKFDALLRLDAVLCEVSKQTIKLSCLCFQVSMKSNWRL